jgi:hypothetical protein
VGESLHEPALAERLAALDLRSFTSVRALRNALISLLEQHLAENPERPAECPASETFYFCRSKSFVMSTGIVARDPKEFFALLPRVSTVSIFFHFVEAPLRLGRTANDFSAWLESQERTDLATAINALDPYTLTLDELKEGMIAIGSGARLG